MGSRREEQDNGLRYSQGVRVTASWGPAGTGVQALGLRKRFDRKYWPRAMVIQKVMGAPRMSEATRERMG